ncbi:MAG: hypothetical protein KDJ88_20240 [Bauldia sp.]|nr:hypothetical protein [Bauldia sp.]
MSTTLYILPLTILPWLVFNIVGITQGSGPWDTTIFSLGMVSDATWNFTSRDLMVVFGIICLFGEILKATNSSSRAIINHAASMVVFIVYLVEFIVVNFAAESVFFILMILALFDVVAGFTITIKTARRDLALGQPSGGP